MAPDQRESRDIMIEFDLSAPPGFFVTPLAATAQLSLVHVILVVTGQTCRRKLVVIEVAGMTAVALDLYVQAAQQARRIAPPEIAPPLALKQVAAEARDSRIVLSESEEGLTLKTALADCRPPLSLAFGPEGGWTLEEVKLLEEPGWKAASLGGTILRAETAAIAATAVAFAELG